MTGKIAGTLAFSTFLVSILWFSPAAYGQVAGGTIQGTVVDSSRAVLPGVTVVIRNTGTGINTELVTNESGVYRAPNLRPGQYEVTASLSGFSTSVQKGIDLSDVRSTPPPSAQRVGPRAEP